MSDQRMVCGILGYLWKEMPGLGTQHWRLLSSKATVSSRRRVPLGHSDIARFALGTKTLMPSLIIASH